MKSRCWLFFFFVSALLLQKQTYKRTWFHRWFSEAAGSPTSSCEESTLRPEWLEALVNEVEIETSSSQEEFELGFMFHEERALAWRSHQVGVEAEVATELSVHSSAMSLMRKCSWYGGNFKVDISVGFNGSLQVISIIGEGDNKISTLCFSTTECGQLLYTGRPGKCVLGLFLK